MSLAALFAIDIVAAALLVFGLYFPRHRRRDMVMAYFGINIGVLGVTQALSSAQVSAGLGLGLFGVLSIIRLRSAEMEQSEVSYYFAALTLGLLGGFPVDPTWMSPVLMGAIVMVAFVADHPRLFGRYEQQLITLDQAYTSASAATVRLEELLGARVHRVKLRKTDLVNDSTIVDVRYELPTTGPTVGTAVPTWPQDES